MTRRQQVEVKLRDWLSSHHGIIGYFEALALGATAEIIQSKLDRGEWVRIYRAVYRDTASPATPQQKLRAAYVATGGRGAVSHASAAWLWDLLAEAPTVPEVTVARGVRSARHKGLTVHRVGDFDLSPPSTGRAS